MKQKTYSTKVDISDFLDHRKFLAAVEADLRSQGVFSHRTFNRECGFSSPNFLQLVIQEKRNLSESAALRVARTLNLSRADTRLVLKLREMNLATDPGEKLELMQNLLKQPGFVQRHEFSQTELSFYACWYNVIVRELLQSHPTLSAAEIGAALIPRVSENDVNESLQQMTTLGFIVRERNKWRVVHKQLSTKNEILSQALISYHSSMIDLARESLTRFRGDQREVSSITLQLTTTEFLELRERIRDFKREALTIETSGEDSQVYQFNFQLFPVTGKIEDHES